MLLRRSVVGGSPRRLMPSAKRATGGQRARRLCLLAGMVCATWWFAWPRAAHAGGGPVNAVLIVDPTQADSLYVANLYRAARGIPERNILYMRPGATDYAAFAAYNLPALLGSMANRGIADHVDYVIVAPGDTFFVPAPNLIIGDACSVPVRRIAISAAYTLAFSDQEILAGTLNSRDPNRYYSNLDDPIAFDSQSSWYGGFPSTDERARRSFIGFLLGYTGERGNSVDELVGMIDRSVRSDQSHPDGTFYLMRTGDDARSGPREPYFARTIASLEALGAKAEALDGILPTGRQDVLGVITGYANLPIDDADMTMLPGAYADHLTSYAATFDGGGQTKLSRWIAKGAAGSAGTVEEPCNGSGKFPHPRILVWYDQGLSLGEALYRSTGWTPFQTLYYGDPLTRPYATFPPVTLLGVPSGEARGPIELAPLTQAATPGVGIRQVDLYVDGIRYASVAAGQSFVLDPYRLGDGYHSLIATAVEDTPARTQGAWYGQLRINAVGRHVELTVAPNDGDRATLYDAAVEAGGGSVREIRLQQGSRVIAASSSASARFHPSGRLLGAGPVELVAVAEYADGHLATSDPVRLTIAPEGEPAPDAPGPAAPEAFSYTADVLPGQPALVDLPATDEDGDPLAATVVEEPAQATVASDGATFLLVTDPSASGTDHLTFTASDGARASEPATVTIRYCTPPHIEADPTSVEACRGTPARLSVGAAGGALAYQWRKDDVPLLGANAATYDVARVSDRDVAFYNVEVTRLCGATWSSVTSADASITIAPSAGCRVSVFLPHSSNQVELR